MALGRGRLQPAHRARAILVAAVVGAATLTAQEPWTIERLEVRYDLEPTGAIRVSEAFDVDFQAERRGLLRDLVVSQRFDATRDRQYVVTLDGVTDASGTPHQVSPSQQGGTLRLRIGNPDVTITGSQTYRIAYQMRGVLNPHPTHDELYWNATGTWPVPIEEARVVLRSPGGGIQRVDCFQGGSGSTEVCESSFTPTEAVFTATRTLRPGEQMTVVAGLARGAVQQPTFLLTERPRDVTRFFDRTPWLLGGLWTGLLLAIGGAWMLWWRNGRDRRYVSLYHADDEPAGSGRPGAGDTGTAAEERVPLFGARPIGVEFEPPDGLRPGQLGLLIDERADTLDVTATIVDLAARGYLRIEEIPKTWILGSTDWRLERLRHDDVGLLDYERIVMKGLFGSSSTREVSDLSKKFYTHLASAKKALYRDAVDRGWFHRNPSTVRVVYAILGVFCMGGGLILALALGQLWGYGLLGLPVALFGFVLALISRAMPRRTGRGRRVMRRALGFAKYIRTAERHPQDFAERANIFTAYLPYAVMFRCVEKWAKAFRDIDVQQATAAFYSGSSGFDAGRFSSSLSSFSSSMSSSMASTPGGSGGSGFSGGSSGGGGGGGGGGSW